MNATLWWGLAFSSSLLAAPPGEVCRPCHAGIVESYRGTGMGRSVNERPMPVPGAYYDRFSNRHYTVTAGAMARHQVDGEGRKINALVRTVTAAIGSGRHAVTYLHRTAEGRWMELPVTWYARRGGYAMSPGYARADHPDFRREIGESCLFCHSDGPEPAAIGCARCHGDPAAHLRAPGKGTAANPARWSAARRLEVCLQCHLETASSGITDALRRPGRAVWSYRPGEPLGEYRMHFARPADLAEEYFEINSAGFRMLQSACFRSSAGRMECTSCHDPHTARVRPGACEACHGEQTHRPPRGDCAGCHMPKRVPADAVETTMTDHKMVRQPRYRDPVRELVREPSTDVVPFYTDADALSLAVARAQGPEALAVYERALRREPAHVPLLVLAGKLALRGGRAERAGELLGRALAAEPREADALYLLGVRAAMAGELDESLGLLERAVRANPDHALAWINLGVTRESRGDREGAAAAYRTAILLQPDAGEARARLARLIRTPASPPR